jgi:DNA-binding PadR family transcriptional regulator
MWGYKIKKQAETKFGVRLGHGTLYPLLNALEKDGFLIGQKHRQGGRTTKVYSLTKKGEEYVEAYNRVLKEQIRGQDIK